MNQTIDTGTPPYFVQWKRFSVATKQISDLVMRFPDRILYVMILLAMACMVLVSGFAVAAPDKQGDRAREQIRRMQQAQSKLEKEKAQLAQEKADIETHNKDIQDKLDQVLKETSELKKRTAVLVNESASLKKDKETLTSRLTETEKNLSVRTESLKLSEEQRSGVESALAERSKHLENCEQKNLKLGEYGNELLEKYKGKSCFDSALQLEPFSQIERVKIENTVEEYQEKLDEQKRTRKEGRQAVTAYCLLPDRFIMTDRRFIYSVTGYFETRCRFSMVLFWVSTVAVLPSGAILNDTAVLSEKPAQPLVS